MRLFWLPKAPLFPQGFSFPSRPRSHLVQILPPQEKGRKAQGYSVKSLESLQDHQHDEFPWEQLSGFPCCPIPSAWHPISHWGPATQGHLTVASHHGRVCQLCLVLKQSLWCGTRSSREVKAWCGTGRGSGWAPMCCEVEGQLRNQELLGTEGNNSGSHKPGRHLRSRSRCTWLEMKEGREMWKKKPQSTQLCLKNRGLEERIGSFGDLRAILIVWQHLWHKSWHSCKPADVLELLGYSVWSACDMPSLATKAHSWVVSLWQLSSTMLLSHSPFSKELGEVIWWKRLTGWDKDRDIAHQLLSQQNRLNRERQM